jgi:hypothetical protein
MREIDTLDVPQANSLSIVRNLLALASVGINDKKRLAAELPLALREVDYYIHAARILGFVSFDPGHVGEFVLTDSGREYADAERLSVKNEILKHAVRSAFVFSEILACHSEQELDKGKIFTFLSERTHLNPTTGRRRADTILAWLKQTL